MDLDTRHPGQLATPHSPAYNAATMGIIIGYKESNHHMSTGKSVTPLLISYMAGAGATALPAPVLQKTKHHILDTIAAMVSGTTLKPGRLALQFAEEQGGKPEAQVIGSSLITSAVTASLANGMLAHSDETDDSNGSAGIHPGCAVIPAALAMAERETSQQIIARHDKPTQL